jgi:hypothetical protein
MRTREEAAIEVERLLDKGVEIKKAFHFGKMEVRALFDFIWEGPPQSKAEEVFEPLRLRNSKVGKWRE